MDKLADIKLMGIAAALSVSHEFAINPNMVGTVYAFEA
jgi:hypothetical protein